MDTRKAGRHLIVLAVLISLCGVVIHIGAIFVGLSWLRFFNAPQSVLSSYEAGTWLAPVSCLVIAGLMGTCAYYAASALDVVRRPPLQRTGLLLMSAICVVRAALLPILAIRHPELRNTFEILAALIWGSAGVGFIVSFFVTS
ncbi:hypothetical protein JCM19000A_17200 [Silvimonas sp. JCM 19000]